MYWLTIILATPLVLTAAIVVSSGVSLWRNYAIARTMGVPMRFLLISNLNPLWQLVDQRVLAYVRRLPFGLGDNSFTRYNWRDWELEDRYKTHQELGDIFLLVTPDRINVNVNDPKAIMSIMRRNDDFDRATITSAILDVFGPSIASARGKAWKAQRRCATRCFNEQNNGVVFEESVSLAMAMLDYWNTKTSVSSWSADMRTLALNVLTRGGFGQSVPFTGGDERRKRKPGEMPDYAEALWILFEYSIPVLIFGPKMLATLAQYWLPSSMRDMHEACASFQSHMTDLYEKEKKKVASGGESDGNLLALLVRASEGEGKDQGEYALTERHIYGNIFVFNFAGHDTTSSVFTFALAFLAANPEIQEWMSEEIDAVLGNRSVGELDYRADFHRLRRCLSVMYETLRLYAPVPTLKETRDAQPLTVGDKTIVIPPETYICCSYASVQTDPRYWGNDSLEWKPSRWIKGSQAAEEELISHERGTFLGWSEGARDCVGRKFSQAEFVGTMAVLFRDSRVDPKTLPGESLDDARRRVLTFIKENAGPQLVTVLLHPEKMPFVWSKRR